MLAPNESYSIPSLTALREVSSLPGKSKMTKSQGEAVLGSFVAKGWLLKSKYASVTLYARWQLTPDIRKGRYSLSTRSLLELQSYLRSTYPNELLECTICMEVCIVVFSRNIVRLTTLEDIDSRRS